MIEEFKKQYTEKVLGDNPTGWDKELSELFDKVLEEEFQGDPMAMDDLVFSLNSPELPQEPTNSDLQKQIAEMQATIDQLLDIITS